MIYSPWPSPFGLLSIILPASTFEILDSKPAGRSFFSSVTEAKYSQSITVFANILAFESCKITRAKIN